MGNSVSEDKVRANPVYYRRYTDFVHNLRVGKCTYCGFKPFLGNTVKSGHFFSCENTYKYFYGKMLEQEEKNHLKKKNSQLEARVADLQRKLIAYAEQPSAPPMEEGEADHW